MANINKTKHGVVELKTELDASGVAMENVYIDGVKAMAIGYSNEKDKQTCLKAIQAAVDSSGSVSEAMKKLAVLANLGDNGVSPDKEININGYTVYVSYKDKTMYGPDGKEIVNCKDIDAKMPDEVIEALLVARAKAL